MEKQDFYGIYLNCIFLTTSPQITVSSLEALWTNWKAQVLNTNARYVLCAPSKSGKDYLDSFHLCKLLWNSPVNETSIKAY